MSPVIINFVMEVVVHCYVRTKLFVDPIRPSKEFWSMSIMILIIMCYKYYKIKYEYKWYYCEYLYE